MVIEEQVHALVLGAMLKDFFLGTATDYGFIAHHSFVVIGCVVCLTLPMVSSRDP